MKSRDLYMFFAITLIVSGLMLMVYSQQSECNGCANRQTQRVQNDH